MTSTSFFARDHTTSVQYLESTGERGRGDKVRVEVVVRGVTNGIMDIQRTSTMEEEGKPE